MDTQSVAKCLESLGHPTRLEIYRLLVRAGEQGLVVGEIQRELSVPASTLSHHVAHLARAGLLRQVRQSRELRCFARYETMDGIIGFLTDQCCTGVT